MQTEAYLGLDLGGTGAKAGVFDRNGAMLGFGQAAYTPVASPDGNVEIPIEDIYNGARDAAHRAIADSGARILAVAVASQGQTFVTLDERDQPLHRTILWYDSRAADQAERMKSALDKAGGADHLLIVEAIASGPKILWLKEHFPENMRRARRYLLLPDYMAYRLTSRAVTEPNTAASTGLFAEDTPGYNRVLLAAAGIKENELAEIMPAGSPVARVLPAPAAEWGLDAETLFVTGTNDQYAGALGAGNCRPGILTETSGTCLALVTLADKLPDPMPAGLFGGRFPITRYYFALAYSKTAGVVLDWFRRECCAGADFEALNALAARVPIGCNGLTVMPHFDGMVSPVPHPALRGAFHGLKLQHTRADLYRAILESLSFCLRENMQFLRDLGFRFDTTRSIGGGAKNDFWLQMKADVTGMPVEKPCVTEAAVLGAAMLAAAGCGQFTSLEEASRALYRPARVFTPDSEAHRQYAEPFQRYAALRRQMTEAN